MSSANLSAPPVWPDPRVPSVLPSTRSVCAAGSALGEADPRPTTVGAAGAGTVGSVGPGGHGVPFCVHSHRRRAVATVAAQEPVHAASAVTRVVLAVLVAHDICCVVAGSDRSASLTRAGRLIREVLLRWRLREPEPSRPLVGCADPWGECVPRGHGAVLRRCGSASMGSGV